MAAHWRALIRVTRRLLVLVSLPVVVVDATPGRLRLGIIMINDVQVTASVEPSHSGTEPAGYMLVLLVAQYHTSTPILGSPKPESDTVGFHSVRMLDSPAE